MHKLILSTLIAGLAAMPALPSSPGEAGQKGQAPEICTTESCGQFGTSVQFVSTPSEAARIALKQEKLVFVLHVSGNFEDPTFT